MELFRQFRLPSAVVILALVGAVLMLPTPLIAQQAGMGGMCPMCGAWGMALGGALVIAIIAALVGLTVFLVRRSRGGRSAT